MLIIGCDFHAGFESLSIFDNRTEEIEEKKLLHPQEATAFYRGLAEPARVGMTIPLLAALSALAEQQNARTRRA